MNLLGLNTDWIAGPVANCYMKGNHLGLEPHTIKNSMEFFLDDIETITGIKIKPTFNRKGAEILFVTPSGDLLPTPALILQWAILCSSTNWALTTHGAHMHPKEETLGYLLPMRWQKGSMQRFMQRQRDSE